MAVQKSILKIEGTVGGLTFYKSGGVHLVKEKGGVSADKIANDPNFARTRENNEEFGSAGTAGKTLRDALRIVMLTASDKLVTSRVTSLMHNAMKVDTTSIRGKRTPAIGLTFDEGKALLKGFNFNANALLGTVLYKSLFVDVASGTVSIAGLIPSTDIAAPAGASHVSFTSALVNVNFETGESDIKLSPVTNMIIDGTMTDINLSPTEIPQGSGLNLVLLKVEFFQEVNSVQYPLKNGAYNALAIVDVA